MIGTNSRLSVRTKLVILVWGEPCKAFAALLGRKRSICFGPTVDLRDIIRSSRIAHRYKTKVDQSIIHEIHLKGKKAKFRSEHPAATLNEGFHSSFRALRISVVPSTSGSKGTGLEIRFPQTARILN